MRKIHILLLAVFSVLALTLVACGNDNDANDETTDQGTEEEANVEEKLDYEPEAINPDHDVCDICAMAVADDQYATQIVLTNDRALKFDDLGCLYAWKEENGNDDIGAEFVRDFNNEEWVQVKDATYVFDEAIDTPMAYGVISFKDEADAQSYIDEHGYGELLSAADLDDHKWEMMDHDHEDDHDD